MSSDSEIVHEDGDMDASEPFNNLNVVEDSARREPVTLELSYPSDACTGNSERFDTSTGYSFTNNKGALSHRSTTKQIHLQDAVV